MENTSSHGVIGIDLLGPLELSEGRRPVDVPGEKLRTILAVLAINVSKPVPRHTLIDELWAESVPTNACNAVQAHITRIRRLLRIQTRYTEPGDIILTTGTGYRLCLPEDSIDSNRFLKLVAEGRRLLPDDPARAEELLKRGLRLWRGPALSDTGSGLFCRTSAHRLDETRLLAREDLIEAKLSQGHHRGLVPELEQLVAHYPLRERFTDQLMTALYRCGRQADALSTYQRARQHLIKDLGLEPSRVLRTRMLEILNHDPSLMSLTG